MTLIDHILAKPNREGTSFENTCDVEKEFIRRVFGDTRRAPAPVASSSSATIVQYDNVGAAIDVAKLILTGEGFEVGVKYHSPKRMQDPALRTSEPMAWKPVSYTHLTLPTKRIV